LAYLPLSGPSIHYILDRVKGSRSGLKEVNKKNKDVDPETLKPWEVYQEVKASWKPIVDRALFDEVQGILEENIKMERRRIADAESRIFLLSGILFCEVCGKSMGGQSAHGSKTIHRYYKHSHKRNKANPCSVKRVNADALEKVVVDHLFKITERAGYFEGLKKKIESNLKDTPAKVEDDIKLTKKIINEIEKEISSVFKLQLTLNSGTEAAQLTSEHLEKLGQEKKAVMNRLLELETKVHQIKDAGELCNEIENNIIDFKRLYHKIGGIKNLS